MGKTRKDRNNRVLHKYEHQRPDGTYEYKYRDRNGVRRSVYAKTLKELRRKEAMIARDRLDNIRDCHTMTVNDLYKKWLDLKRGIKDNTLQGYKYLYLHYIKKELGGTKISGLRKSDIKALYNRLVDVRGLSVNTVSNVHIVLRQILDIAVEDDYLRKNPADGALTEIKKMSRRNPLKPALTRLEHKTFEEFLLSDTRYRRWYPIFIILLYTGMRVGELVGLRWRDIDLEKGVIDVNHTLVYYDRGEGLGCGFSINTPKSKAGSRTIPMLPKVKEAFLMERDYLEKTGLTCSLPVDGYTDFIFLNRFGRPYHQGTLNKALKRIVRACNGAGPASRHDTVLNLNRCNKPETGISVAMPTEPGRRLPHFTNHSLRHTFATRMCEADINIKAIQAIMGHSEIKLTLDTYVQATEYLKQNGLADFNRYYAALDSAVS